MKNKLWDLDKQGEEYEWKQSQSSPLATVAKFIMNSDLKM